MGRKVLMIKIIWTTLDNFIETWRNSPYLWTTEIDIQADIACRLRQAFYENQQRNLEASYSHVREGKIQAYSRVCCEWQTNYIHPKDGKACFAPDIIVYKDISDSKQPPDQDKYTNWPMLWVCEIKHNTEDTSAQYREYDKKKMMLLLEQNQTEYACLLYFDRVKVDKKQIEFKEELNGRLRNYVIRPRI